MRKSLAVILAVLMIVSATGCAHKHEFSEATCTQPKTCIECGETEGEPLPHTFKDATCTEPKTCTVCEFTEGEALGHDVSIGRCGRCGQSINFDVIEDIYERTQAADRYFNTAFQYINNASGSINSIYKQYCTAYDYLKQFQSSLSEIADICAKYPELKKCYSALKNVVNCTISMPSNNVNSLSAFIDQVVELSTLDAVYATEMKNWLNKQ